MSRGRNPAAMERERKKREGVAQRAADRAEFRVSGERNDPWTGERILRVNGVDTYPDWD